MYQALFGMMVIPYEILYTRSGAIRYQTQYELDFIYRNLNEFFNCRIDRLPLEIIYQETNSFLHSGSAWKEYHECIENTTGFKIQHHLNSCTSEAPFDCRFNVATAIVNGCHSAKVHAEGWRLPHNQLPNKNITSRMQSYYICLHQPKWVKAAEKCSLLAKKVCGESNVRSVKVLRLLLKDTEELILRFPDIKIIHQLRDPRGIVVSARSMGLMSAYSQQKMSREA